MTLSIIPDSLQFVPKLAEDNSLQLTNVSFKPLLFRIRTTAPHRYVVKPTKGVVQPNKTETISIHLADTAGADAAASPDMTLTDEFAIIYSEQADTDVIAPKAANVPDIIKARAKSDLSKRNVKSVVTAGKQVVRSSESQPAAAAAATVAPKKEVASPLPAPVAGDKEKMEAPVKAASVPNNNAAGSPATGGWDLETKKGKESLTIAPFVVIALLALILSYFLNLFE